MSHRFAVAHRSAFSAALAGLALLLAAAPAVAQSLHEQHMQQGRGQAEGRQEGAPHGASPYAGQEARRLKALAPQEIEDLRQGRGMGLAKPAELNGYPGPAHVLELAGPLDLTAGQRTRTEALFEAMQAEAQALGERILQKEAALERGFARGSLDAAALEALTGEIGALYGQLRAVHLRTHLAQYEVLSRHQRARYDALRGYSEGSGTR